ncbi:hypothetical protein MMC28_004514 [Mycoblastus sanguinarius]|nr:hypothetical protein [Mycoblastus sanguinarius]
MSRNNGQLGALDQRLKQIMLSPNFPVDSITEATVIDSAKDKYICGECTWTGTVPKALAGHYIWNHLSFCCQNAGCQSRFRSEAAFDIHWKEQHELNCTHPGCHQVCKGKRELSHHLQDVHGSKKAAQSLRCPDPNCSLMFPDHDSLFQHYDGLHSLSIILPGRDKQFKCPFCPKAYRSERYMKGHQQRDHKPNRWAQTYDEALKNQEDLFKQSYELMERNISTASFGTSAEADDESDDTNQLQEEEDYSITIRDGTLYIDDDPVVASPTPEPSTPRFLLSNPQPRNEKMAIGFLLTSPLPERTSFKQEDATEIADERSDAGHADDEDDENDYPEMYALDECERPRKIYKIGNITDQFPDVQMSRRIFRWVLSLLEVDHFMGVSEIMDLWTTFLTPDQRTLILEQLHNIKIDQDDSKILSVLHGTVLNELIHSWAQFKLLAHQVPAHLIQQGRSAKDFTWAVIKYCMMLETLMNEGRPSAIANGVSFPDLLRQAPLSEISVDVPFIDLLSALVDRVKCRTCHPEWLQLTNVMVLKEMGDYIQELKTMVKAIYFPTPDNMDDWYEMLGL